MKKTRRFLSNCTLTVLTVFPGSLILALCYCFPGSRAPYFKVLGGAVLHIWEDSEPEQTEA